MAPEKTSSALYPVLTRMNIVTADIVAVNQTLERLRTSSIMAIPHMLSAASWQKQITKDTEAVIAALHVLEHPLDQADAEQLIFESRFHDYLLRDMLSNFEQCKPAFQNVLFVADLSKTVQAGLRQGRDRVYLFSEAAQKTMPSGMVIPEVEMLTAWDSAIAAFDEPRSDRVCLPDMTTCRRYIGL